jgi:hypothetical protein
MLGAIAWVWLVPIAIVRDAVPALALKPLLMLEALCSALSLERGWCRSPLCVTPRLPSL